MKNYELGEDEFKIIRFLKSQLTPDPIQSIKEFWAERSLVPIDIIFPIMICEKLSEIYFKATPHETFRFILDMSPSQRFWYGIHESVTDYWEICLLILMSKIRNTEIKYFIGYVEWSGTILKDNIAKQFSSVILNQNYKN